MEAQSNVRVRMAPMAALTGVVMVTTAATVSAPPVQRAIENVGPAVVHQVKTLPVQLTAYNPFAPYAQPVGVIGYALTTVFATQTAVTLPIFDGATETLTAAGLDPRWAEQPQLIARSLVLPLAVATQTALVGALEGTYIYGKFTPAEALSFFIDAVKAAFDGFVAAERALFGGQQASTADAVGVPTPGPDVSSTEIPDTESVLTLSTAQAGDSAPASLKPTASGAASTDAPQQAAVENTGEDAVTEAAEAEVEAEKPSFAFPTFKLPALKVPKPKSLTPRKVRSAATAGAPTSKPKADNDSGPTSRTAGSAGSSGRGGDTG